MVRGVQSGSPIQSGGDSSGSSPAQKEIGLAQTETNQYHYKFALGHLKKVKEDLQKTDKLTPKLKTLITKAEKILEDLEQNQKLPGSPEGRTALNLLIEIGDEI